MIEVHIFVTGTIQGVGFRAAVKKYAAVHHIHGYVRNLSDGRVEICAQGQRDQIQAFIHVIQTKPGRGAVSDLSTKTTPLHETFSSFEIL